jgi:hypothetical protein
VDELVGELGKAEQVQRHRRAVRKNHLVETAWQRKRNSSPVRTGRGGRQRRARGIVRVPSEPAVPPRLPPTKGVTGIVRWDGAPDSGGDFPKGAQNKDMNQPIECGGSCQTSLLPGISDPKKSQHLPPPPGGQDEVRGESPGIPFCSSGFPDLSQLVSELELIRLLGRGGSPTPRAQRAVCRRWIEKHDIPTMRMGRSRFHPRAQVLVALMADPTRPTPPRYQARADEIRATLRSLRSSLGG